jgi:peptidoglycan/xylan/chitin deacetylase (PgdA/CDA1 family)
MHPRNQLAVPIAMLHAIGTTTDPMLRQWFLSRNSFLQMLDCIEKGHFHTTHFAEINGGNRPLEKPLVLSFDDCYKHLFDFAVPELVKRKMKAVFYMPSAYVGDYNQWDVEKGAGKLELMNKNDLRELVELGMEIGSHSHTHTNLKNTAPEQFAEEARTSKQRLEDITGSQVLSFAYPYGGVPANYQTILQEQGYRYAVAIYHPSESNFALRRFGVYESDTVATLRRKFSSRYRWIRKVYDAIKKYD